VSAPSSIVVVTPSTPLDAHTVLIASRGREPATIYEFSISPSASLATCLAGDIADTPGAGCQVSIHGGCGCTDIDRSDESCPCQAEQEVSCGPAWTGACVAVVSYCSVDGTLVLIESSCISMVVQQTFMQATSRNSSSGFRVLFAHRGIGPKYGEPLIHFDEPYCQAAARLYVMQSKPQISSWNNDTDASTATSVPLFFDDVGLHIGHIGGMLLQASYDRGIVWILGSRTAAGCDGAGSDGSFLLQANISFPNNGLELSNASTMPLPCERLVYSYNQPSVLQQYSPYPANLQMLQYATGCTWGKWFCGADV